MDNNDSGGATALVAIVAIIVIVGLAYVLLRNTTQQVDDAPRDGASIELNLGGGQSSAAN